MPVRDSEKEVAHLSQVRFDAADHRRAIGVANFFRDHADHEGPLVAQASGKKVRMIIQLFRCGVDAFFGLLGNRAGGWRIVENHGNRTRSQAHMVGQSPNRNGGGFGFLAFGHE